MAHSGVLRTKKEYWQSPAKPGMRSQEAETW